jgi:hypothetical protein
MFSLGHLPESVLSSGLQVVEVAGPESPWEVLEQLVRELQGCPDNSSQIRATLKAIRAGIAADVVYWYPGPGEEAVPLVGEPHLSAVWCRAFAEQQFAADPAGGSQRLLSPAGDVPPGFLLVPHSAAMLRVSKSRPVWIVAVRFHPGRRFQQSDVQMMALARRLLLHQRHQARAQEKLKDALFGLVRSLIAALNAKNQYTYGHSERVARIARRLGRQMGLSPALQSDLYLAGLLHDVGKIGIRSRVLQLTGPLSPEDRAHIEEHPVIGDAILAGVKALAHLRPGVRNHHERYDGRGYPDGLAGPHIPLLARILAVADACDAMRSARPYRLAMPTEQVDAILAAGAGSQWDPQVIDHFLACRRELYGFIQKGVGDSVVQAVAEVVKQGDEE